MEHIIICPITCQIMNNPVIASDGNIYERDAIEEWYYYSCYSPITRQFINDEFYDIVKIKNLIDMYLDIYPDKRKEQYKTNYDMINNINRINNFIIKGNFEKLMNYKKYTLSKIQYVVLLYKCDNNIIKYIIDNSENLEYEDNGRRLLHILCLGSNIEIIKYIIDKDINLNCGFYTPIFLITNNNNLSLEEKHTLINIIENKLQKKN